MRNGRFCRCCAMLDATRPKRSWPRTVTSWGNNHPLISITCSSMAEGTGVGAPDMAVGVADLDGHRAGLLPRRWKPRHVSSHDPKFFQAPEPKSLPAVDDLD